MLGFIKKDINMVKSNFKLIGVLLIVYAFLAFTNKMDIIELWRKNMTMMTEEP